MSGSTTGKEGGEIGIVECLAGSGRKFRKCQIRVRSGLVHLQAEGVPVNREYGVAIDFAAPADVLDYIENLEHTEPSLAGTGALYVPAQFTPISDQYVQVQVKGKEFNRDYGLTFKVFSPELVMLYNNISIYDELVGRMAKLEIEEP